MFYSRSLLKNSLAALNKFKFFTYIISDLISWNLPKNKYEPQKLIMNIHSFFEVDKQICVCHIK